MRRALVVALLVAFSAEAQKQRAVRPPVGVPPAYRQLYLYLDNALTYFQNRIDTVPGVPKNDVLFAAELITANGNRGTDLLAAQTLPGVRVNLDALQRLGVNAAAVTVVYPLLDPSYPRHADYLDFYKGVAAEVRSRRMKLIVKASVAFAGTTFSNVNVDYSSLTASKYAGIKRDMAATLLRELTPDYLNLVGEPDTEASLTKLTALNDAAAYTSILNSILTGLDRGRTKIGAGTGSWTSPSFAESFARSTSIDYVDIHLYPVWPFATDNALAIADAAHRYGKSVAMTEVWLYKASPDENGGIAATADIFKRDTFSFWEPLDAKFLRVIASFARREHLEFVSPFWSAYFFGNVTYGPSTAGLSYAQLSALANQAAAQGMVAGQATPLGADYASVIANR